MSHLYRSLPSVDALLQSAAVDTSRSVALAACRSVLADVRAELAGGATALPDLALAVRRRVRLLEGRLQPVINATGVVVHTNLGRSQWSPRARRAAQAAMGACNVELSLPTGKRGGRMDGVRAQLAALCDAEDALVVNNCASAVLLALTALAKGREVVVSRGELVEIGGSFRVPDVIASCGAELVEVGATNRTRASDYGGAIGEKTGALLVVHPSNFRQVGFVESANRRDLVHLADAHDLPLLEDVGSGALSKIGDEPSVRAALAAGVHLVMFSGDKLLGGPQSGIIVGKRRWVRQLARHPLYRALRVGKVTLAALEGTLADHLHGEPPPTLRQLQQSVDPETTELHAELCALGLDVQLRDSVGRAGGGTLPEHVVESKALFFPGWSESHARVLRTGHPAVVARLHDGGLWVDLRCVAHEDVEPLRDRLLEAGGGGPVRVEGAG